MTYIIDDKRRVIDPALYGVVDALRQLECDYPEGSFEANINYVVTRLLVLAYGKTSYDDINDVVGALECAKLEFYRRKAGPFSDQEAFVNGDVYPPVQL